MKAKDLLDNFDPTKFALTIDDNVVGYVKTPTKRGKYYALETSAGDFSITLEGAEQNGTAVVVRDKYGNAYDLIGYTILPLVG